MENSSKNSIGFIGLGNMGLPMVFNLLASQKSDPHLARIAVTGRSRERAEAATRGGALWVDSPRELANISEVIVLMVPDSLQVEHLLFGPEGIATATSSSIVVVSSTISPESVRSLDQQLRQRTAEKMRLVDAPVSGGTEGAQAGTLSIMVGGDVSDVEKVLPILSHCGNPVHLGPLGAGQVAKACNQLIVASTMVAISEASVIAERSGLELSALLTLLEGGYASSRVLETKRERLVKRDYTVTGAAKFMVKDLSFAVAEASATHTPTPLLDTVFGEFCDLTEAGLGEEDLAVFHRFVWEKKSAEYKKPE
ncbi:NAD(P)-dependent oxidoreductase [Lysinibacter sp. HNR]|uniref:NAD(P)-dependent oxidoreductase n=1 Tax=Lysinibacter sp. HNR TaxID=3031408 RepID=UPI00243604DD|nr:NAD(P)-dependent oxidoreductase [Lysinibacter sp. HNR]WGD36325.1 NAD(P)-dependent oxidoreductase [Lysinibacter sp. HNR]